MSFTIIISLLKRHIFYEHDLFCFNMNFSNERICTKPHFQLELKVQMLSKREKASNEVINRTSMIKKLSKISLVSADVDIFDFA